jgi:hypothetical protein
MENGRVHSHGSLSESIAADATLAHAVEEEEDARQRGQDEIDPEKPISTAPKPADASAIKGKLVAKEEISEGHVGLDSCKYCLLIPKRPWLTFPSSQTLLGERRW